MLSSRLPLNGVQGLAGVCLCALATVGCFDGSGTGPQSGGSLRLSLRIRGDSPDPDGCVVWGKRLRDGESFLVDGLLPSTYLIDVRDVAPNCCVQVGTAAVRAGQTAHATVGLDCPTETASIEVSTNTTGSEVSPDGYTVAVDPHTEWWEPVPAFTIGVNDTRIIEGLAQCHHEVYLQGIPEDCARGSTDASATITADEPAHFGFDIRCPGPLSDHIAFSSDREGNAEIFVMAADGSNPVRLTRWSDPNQEPAWSPDARQIAYTTVHDAYDREFRMINVMTTSGYGSMTLVRSLTSNVSPAWSPDGTKIAYSSSRDYWGGDLSSEIFVMEVDGSSPVILTNHTAEDLNPAWSPDGSSIAFSSDRDGNAEIYVIDADGSMPVNLTHHAGFDSDPAWSPDGTRIAFSSDRDGNAEIYVMAADGSNPVNLTSHTASDWEPVWSPDGTQIAYTSNREGNDEIYVMNEDGSDPANLTNHPGADGDPSWSRRH